MQLLLFISALLASLTGAFSGDRAVRVGGQQGGAAITRIAEAVAETAVAIAENRSAAVSTTIAPATATPFAISAPPLALPARLTTGRWLE